MNMFQSVIVLLFQLLVFTVPLSFTWINDELFEFNKMILTYILTVIIVATWLMRMVTEKRTIFKRTAFDIPILLFLISQLLSTFFSIHPQTSIFGYYSRFHGGLLSTITYISLYYAFVSNISKSELKKIFFTAASSAGIVSIYGILEHFGRSPSCLLITGSFDVSCWIQDVKTRVFATFGQPNWLAAYAITLIPIAIALSLSTKQFFLRQFYIVISVLLYTVLLFTQSRSGILGFFVSTAIFAIGYSFIYIKTNKPNLSLKLLAFLGCLIVFISLLFGTAYTPSLSSLTLKDKATKNTRELNNGSINRLEIGGTDSGEIRKIVWTGAFKIWQRYPILGSGVETFAYSYYLDRPLAHNLVSEWDFLYNKAHNEYLNILATSGIVGLLTYLLLQITFSFKALKYIYSKHDHRDRLIVVSLLSAYSALSVSNFFGFSTVMIGIFFFLLPAILEIVTKAEFASAKATQHTHNSVFYIANTGIAVLGIFFISSIVKYWHADVLYTRAKSYFALPSYPLGISTMQTAIDKNPNEALFYDSLSDTYSQIASQLYTQDATPEATQFANQAIALNDQARAINPAHLNFYKTRIRIFITLSNLDAKYLEDARVATVQALEKAPTDAKLQFTLAQILKSQGKAEEALLALEKTVEMKPNYEAAFQILAQTYLEQNQPDKARATAQYILSNINPGNAFAQEIATLSGSLGTESIDP